MTLNKMTDLNNELEIVKLAGENRKNSLSHFILMSQKEKGMLVDEPIEEFIADIPKNRKESEFVNVSLLYEFKNLPTFVKYFSVSEIISRAYSSLEEMTNVVAFIVNSSNALLKECEWNYTILNSNNLADNINNRSENKLVVSHITQFLSKFVNSALKSGNSTMPIHVYKFNSGENTKSFLNFDPSSILDTNEDEISEKNSNDESLIKIKKFLLPLSNKTTFSNKCEINEALSKVFNSENNELKSDSNLFLVKSAFFIRIILFTGSPTTQIDSAMYNSIMSTFNKSKGKIRGAVVNFMLVESDFYFNNLNSEDEILKFSDINYTNIDLCESTEKMKVLCEVYKGIECEIKELSDRILIFGISYFDPENMKDDKEVNKEKNENVEIIIKFVKKIDSDFKLFSDLVDAVAKYNSDVNKKETRKDVVQNSKKNLEELKDGNLISQILNILQKTLEEFYQNKSMKEKVFQEVKREIKTLNENIRRIEKKIKSEGKKYEL